MSRLFAIGENDGEYEKFHNKRWEDFDHSQKFPLGVRGYTWTVRDKKTSRSYVLQSCADMQWDDARSALLDLAKDRRDLFVPPKYIFFRRQQVYVCSESGGVSLADLIDATLPITELHAAVVAKKIIKCLLALAANDLSYDLKAARVFLDYKDVGMGCEDVSVRLAGFGSRLQPTFQTDSPNDCANLGHLTYHMLTRVPEINEELSTGPEQMITIRTKSINIPLTIDQDFSSELLDFLESCMDPSCTLQNLLHHAFLRPRAVAQLGPLIRHAKITTLIGAQWCAARDEGGVETENN